MASVAEVTDLIKAVAPEEFYYKKEYDNIGLIVGSNTTEVSRVLCCLDATTEVIKEAIDKKAGLIISHHPVIFYPLQKVSDEDVIGRKIMLAIQNDISIYAAHTNLDFVTDGINEYVASVLNLINIESLESYLPDGAGYGRVGKLPCKMSVSQVKRMTEKALNDKFVRVIGDMQRHVGRVAVINGGGGGDIKAVDLAVRAGADCLITGDVKHHVAVYAMDCGMPIIEPQHYTMEHIYIARLVQTLKIEAKSKRLSVEILQAAADICPRG